MFAANKIVAGLTAAAAGGHAATDADRSNLAESLLAFRSAMNVATAGSVGLLSLPLHTTLT